jgi:hypothetical protein
LFKFCKARWEKNGKENHQKYQKPKIWDEQNIYLEDVNGNECDKWNLAL